VIGAYHRLTRTCFAVLAVLAVGRLLEDRTGWSIRRFVRTAGRYRTVQIRTAGPS
jgi:hypothetical protein